MIHYGITLPIEETNTSFICTKCKWEYKFELHGVEIHEPVFIRNIDPMLWHIERCRAKK